MYGLVHIKKTNTIKTYVFKQLDYIFINYSTLDSERNGEDLRIRKHSSLPQLNHGRSKVCWCFIMDLLMQHKFCCVDLISRSWRTRKTNWFTPTYLVGNITRASTVLLDWMLQSYIVGVSDAWPVDMEVMWSSQSTRWQKGPLMLMQYNFLLYASKKQVTGCQADLDWEESAPSKQAVSTLHK